MLIKVTEKWDSSYRMDWSQESCLFLMGEIIEWLAVYGNYPLRKKTIRLQEEKKFTAVMSVHTCEGA